MEDFVKFYSLLTISIRWVSVVEFHDGALGIGKVFGQESTVVKWNFQILRLHLVTVCQKVPILDFQSEFSMSKIIRIFLKKNSLKNINLGQQLWLKSFFDKFNLKNNSLLKLGCKIAIFLNLTTLFEKLQKKFWPLIRRILMWTF